MLQILGWLGCFYLLVKAVEFLTDRGYRGEDDIIGMRAIAGATLCGIGAIAFLGMFNTQASGGSGPSSYSSDYSGDYDSNLAVENLVVEDLVTNDTLSNDIDAY